jgi:hypothetical protein
MLFSMTMLQNCEKHPSGMVQSRIMPPRKTAPIFIVGAQRSGTTMTRLMLNAHPNIAVPFETNFIPQYFFTHTSCGPLTSDKNVLRLISAIQAEPLVSRGPLAHLLPENILRILPERSYPAIVRTLFQVYAQTEGKRRWGDKTPGAEVHINLLS